MSSTKRDISHLTDRQLLQEPLLGRSAFQPGIFEQYIEEAKHRGFDSASYADSSISLVDYLSAIDVSRTTIFDEATNNKRSAFPGVSNRAKRVTGPIIALIGVFFLFSFFSWLSNPVWPMLLFGIAFTVSGVFRFHAGRATGYFLDTDGLHGLTKNSSKGASIFNWTEVTEVELAEVPRRRSFFSLFASAFIRFAQDVALGKTENQVRFGLDDGREVIILANKLQHFELFVIAVRRIRNLTSAST